jgi:hypothetical protein
MQPSMNDLVVRQVSALVSTTADAVCTSGENVPSMEAQFYESLAMHCAEKQRRRPRHLQTVPSQGLKRV